MLADYHVIQALQRGWRVVSANRDQWLAQFSRMSVPSVIKSGVPIDGATNSDFESMAAQWYDQICGSGIDDNRSRGLNIVPAFVHGSTPMPCVLVELKVEPVRLNEQPMGINTVDSAYVRYAMTNTVMLTIHAPTKAQVVALSVMIVSILGQSGSWFTSQAGGLHYRNPQIERLTDLTPLPDLVNKEKIGAFRRAISWSMARDNLFPPLFAEPEAPAYLSVHDVDSQDAWGNWGRVRAEPDEE